MRQPLADWVRVLAVGLVFLSHAEWYWDGGAAKLWLVGQYGVALFFVLSGYLLGGSLRRKEVGVVGFWWKRWTRTLPLFWFFCLLHGVPRSYWTLTETLVHAPRHGFYESWSLMTEELFYLVLPVVVLLVGYEVGILVMTTLGEIPMVMGWHVHEVLSGFPWLAVGLLLARFIPRLPTVPASRVVEWLADRSYALYLVQLPMRDALPWWDWLPACLLASHALRETVERAGLALRKAPAAWLAKRAVPTGGRT